jgi:IclR family transcriptional regulator, acetate operon repressor
VATPSLRSTEKAFELLQRIVQTGDSRSISALAADLQMPPSTAHRISATLERAGFIMRLRRGHYLPGPVLLRLATFGSLNRVLAAVGPPVVKRLARQSGCTAHLGVFENAMVTYLLKAGKGRLNIFTRQGTQLEAYCTGIGKVLLASLPKPELEEYLAQGPFIALTPNTLTDIPSLRAALDTIRVRGYATDNAEMDTDLRCLAVPVHDGERTLAALSISTRRPDSGSFELAAHLELLQAAAVTLAKRFALPAKRAGTAT